jgi:hypothetical protein
VHRRKEQEGISFHSLSRIEGYQRVIATPRNENIFSTHRTPDKDCDKCVDFMRMALAAVDTVRDSLEAVVIDSNRFDR